MEAGSVIAAPTSRRLSLRQAPGKPGGVPPPQARRRHYDAPHFAEISTEARVVSQSMRSVQPSADLS